MPWACNVAGHKTLFCSCLFIMNANSSTFFTGSSICAYCWSLLFSIVPCAVLLSPALGLVYSAVLVFCSLLTCASSSSSCMVTVTPIVIATCHAHRPLLLVCRLCPCRLVGVALQVAMTRGECTAQQHSRLDWEKSLLCC